MLSRFDRKGNAGFALTELTVRFLIRTTEMTAVRISDAGMEQITPSGPNQTGGQRAAAAEKAERRDGKARPAACVVKKATTGYAGGHKEFHLWIEKENLR